MRLTALLAVLLTLGGCMPFRRAKAPPPPGPTPARIPDQVASVAPAPPPKNLPPPPAIATGTAADANTAPATALGVGATPVAGPPRPPKPKKQPVRRAAVTPPATVAAAAPPPMEPQSEAPPFRLGELRTADEKEKLRREAEQYIGQCAAALSAAEGRNLSAMQTEMVARIRTFAQQARDTMDRDLGEARNFAAKGRTFAEALLAELR